MPRSAVMQGLKRMQDRLKAVDFVSAPAGPFLREWKADFKQFAIEKAPEWTGDLKDKIQAAQDTKKFPLWAQVFSSDPKARWANFGTGLLSTDPNSAKQRYFPSVSGIRRWAEDHDMDPYALARSIFRVGGTKGSHFFELAAEAANQNMNDRLGKFGSSIQSAAKSK